MAEFTICPREGYWEVKPGGGPFVERNPTIASFAHEADAHLFVNAKLRTEHRPSTLTMPVGTLAKLRGFKVKASRMTPGRFDVVDGDGMFRSTDWTIQDGAYDSVERAWAAADELALGDLEMFEGAE